MKKIKITSIEQMKTDGKEVATRDYIISYGEIFVRFFIEWDVDRKLFLVDGGIDGTQMELTEEQLASNDFTSIAQAIQAGNFYEEVDLDVRCTNCMNEYIEDELVLILEDPKDMESGMKACPECKTDHYLMDID